MEKFTDYSLLFAFSQDFKEVLLILKNKPDFQKGRFNGIGGKVEPGETPEEAAGREFGEECGTTLIDEPLRFCIFTDKDQDDTTHRIYCFATNCLISDNYNSHALTKTPEQVFRIKVDDLPFLMVQGRLLANVMWLVPMAINRIKYHKEEHFIEVIK